MKGIWILFSFFMLVPFLASAQSEKAQMKEMSEAAIKDIKNGVLIVRLESWYKKKLVLKIDRYPEKDEENKMWMEAFKSFYNFSEVLFVYDTTSKVALRENDGRYCFLNESLEIDSIQSLLGRSYAMTFFGTNNNNESLSYKNRDFKTLDSPFPKPRNINHPLTYLITKAFTNDDPEWKNMERIIRKMNTRFYEYYDNIKS